MTMGFLWSWAHLASSETLPGPTTKQQRLSQPARDPHWPPPPGSLPDPASGPNHSQKTVTDTEAVLWPPVTQFVKHIGELFS